MLKQAQRKLKRLSNVKVEKISILELPYKDNSFDVVVAANVIHLLDDPGAALKGLVRVCKQGGKIIIPTYINKQKKNATVAVKLMAKIGVDFRRQFDLVSYQKFFSDFGFDHVEYRVVDGRMPCAFAIIKKKQQAEKSEL
jgi:ubiquinone/menaquinone biosynthesis C-methylase UbiE